MLRPGLVSFVIFVACGAVANADPANVSFDAAQQVSELSRAVQQGDVSSIQRSWKSTVTCGAAAIVPLLQASQSFTNNSELNWIISATHRAANSAISQKQSFDERGILQFINDQSRPSVTRRLALDIMDKVQPGYRAEFLKQTRDDSEFLRDQIAEQIDQATRLREQQQDDESRRLLVDAYRRARDAEQIAGIFRQLNDAAIEPSLHQRLGIVPRWWLIGPFPSEKEKGPTTIYPVDTSHVSQPLELVRQTEVKFAEKLYTWKMVQLPTDATSLKFSLGFPGMNDSVSFAYSLIESESEQVVEILASGGETLELWLNATKIIDAPFYNQRPRMDRHRAQAKLKPGTNALLAKVCTGEGAGEGGGRGGSPTGELFLRITTLAGQAIEVKQK